MAVCQNTITFIGTVLILTHKALFSDGFVIPPYHYSGYMGGNYFPCNWGYSYCSYTPEYYYQHGCSCDYNVLNCDPCVHGVPSYPQLPGLIFPAVPDTSVLQPVSGLTSFPGLSRVSGLTSVSGIASVPGLTSVPGLGSVYGLPSFPGLVSVPESPSVPASPSITSVENVPFGGGATSSFHTADQNGVEGFENYGGVNGNGEEKENDEDGDDENGEDEDEENHEDEDEDNGENDEEEDEDIDDDY